MLRRFTSAKSNTRDAYRAMFFQYWFLGGYEILLLKKCGGYVPCSFDSCVMAKRSVRPYVLTRVAET